MFQIVLKCRGSNRINGYLAGRSIICVLAHQFLQPRFQDGLLAEAQRAGKIVNIASIAGLGTGSAHSPGYSATKAGVISLTKTTALDVAGANIYVNAIACGGVLTPPFEEDLARASDEQKQRLYQMLPLGRIGRPEEYASLAVYLASDEHYLVGQVISPNGGLLM